VEHFVREGVWYSNRIHQQTEVQTYSWICRSE